MNKRLSINEYKDKPEGEKEIIKQHIIADFLRFKNEGHSIPLCYRKVHFAGRFNQFLVRYVVLKDDELKKQNIEKKHRKTAWSHYAPKNSLEDSLPHIP